MSRAYWFEVTVFGASGGISLSAESATPCAIQKSPVIHGISINMFLHCKCTHLAARCMRQCEAAL